MATDELTRILKRSQTMIEAAQSASAFVEQALFNLEVHETELILRRVALNASHASDKTSASGPGRDGLEGGQDGNGIASPLSH